MEISDDLKGLAEDSIFEVNHFLSILYGTMVRFYNTVVKWQDLDFMKEDIIEILTSKLFANEKFSSLMMELSRFVTFEDEKKFIGRLRDI